MTFEEEYQAWLDEFDAYTFSRDYAGWRARYILPFTYSTGTAKSVVNEEDELEVLFHGWVDMMESLGATRVQRTSRGVKPVGPDLLIGHYTSVLFDHDTPIGAPFDGSGLLQRMNGAWLVREMWIGVENRTFPLSPPRNEPITDISDALNGIAKGVKK